MSYAVLDTKKCVIQNGIFKGYFVDYPVDVIIEKRNRRGGCGGESTA